MNTYIKCVFSLIICLGCSLISYTQDCGPQSGGVSALIGGKVIISYGATTNSVTPKFASNILLGQAVIGQNNSTKIVAEYGFYTQFLLPPLPPTVTASQGELLDRIQVSWSLDPLGSAPNEGFNLFRDGVFIANVGPKVRNFNDFNVIAGRPYTYSVTGLNKFGEGFAGEGLGFQVPNGVVTGWVSTLNNRPVPGAQVSLMPMQGFSAKFGPQDGGVTLKDNDQPFLPTVGEDWTMTFWMNTSASNANGDVISFNGSSLEIKALPGANGVSVTQGANNLTSNFAKDEWHHITLGYEAAANTGRLYIDGVLEDQSTMSNISSPDFINFGQDLGANGWSGYLDEFRIYHTLLDELDLGMVMEGTASSTTPFLSHYWKFDEELGEKSFDIMNRHQLYFCGASFDAERPPVRTAAVTNEEGYYLIEGVSYGTGTTFIAEPEKNFYLHRSLDFKSSEADHITLPNFALPSKTTIELWLNNTNAGSEQTILSKKEGSNKFRIYSELQGPNNEIKVDINGNIQSFGNIPTGFNHLAFAIDSAASQIKGYINGGSPITRTYSITSNWSDPTTNWYVAANSDGTTTSDYFNGSIDELAVYDTLLSAATILTHAQNARDLTADGLLVYFPMDEGSGIRVSNSGSMFLEFGTIMGAEWSNFAANQETTPHEFTPRTRQVTLNPSVTSVDQVDFSDLSTIAVSGYVRYKNTDCFAPNVEILVNGSSFSPNIYTDSLGKFVIDFDPGATASLTPKFEDHVFVPAFFDVTSVSSPIAGILFNDITTRKVSGQVAGGSCKKSVIMHPAGNGLLGGTVCKVEVRSTDGCLIRAITINNQAGNFEFLDLPPLERMNVAVIEHDDDAIKTAFQVQGGFTVDLTKTDTIIDFIYTAPPEVEINNGLEAFPGCSPPMIVLDEGGSVTVEIKVKETYIPNLTTGDNGICYLDTANLKIINGFADQSIDTFMSGESFDYTFIVGQPNSSPPYLKTMQVVATSVPAGRVGSEFKKAIVTGTLTKLQTFTTMMPLMPSLILRDPPGDGSSSFIEKSEKICKITEMSMEVEAGVSGSVDIEVAPTINFVVAPFGLGTIVTVDPDFQINIESEVTYSKHTDTSFQTCVTFNNKISTSDGDVIVGGERGGDLYMGEAINLIYGNADKVTFDNCEVNVEQIVIVQPGTFATTFIYSEFNIKNNILPNLDRLRLDSLTNTMDSLNYVESITRWEAIIERNDSLKEDSKFIRNISFDAGVSYEYSETADTIENSSDQNSINTDSKIGTTFGFSGNNVGAKFKVNAIVKSSNSWKTADGTEKGLTTGYTLADDDPGDAFTVDVSMDTVYKTPVFNIKAGQSSCPWEPGTANREGPNLVEASPTIAINVPANESAVFKFFLGNFSATNEDWTYGFTSIAASNPDGAIIKVNGQVLNNKTIQYIVPNGQSVPITLTVDRGPVAYEYSDLLVALVSECELERNLALSIPLESDTLFFSSVKLSVDFIRPCSEVKINVPEQNWVVINDDPDQPGTLRRITVSGYDQNSPDFQLIRMQYRKSDGNGAWITLPTPNGINEAYNPKWSGFSTIPNSPDTMLLGPNFTQFFWETAGIEDGNYEFHAWAVCSGDASDKPGFSDIIKGKIDRQPPSLLGVPQPSDGVYHVGDEISFTFNQDINCNKLIQADMINANNIGLYDATTNDLIDLTISCLDNKIVLNPTFQNEFFENKILRAELHNIQDLVGNTMVEEIWAFYVDRNELAWLTDSIELTKYSDETKTITAKIHNRGGYPVPYSMIDLPEWVHVSPSSGTLVANEIEEINFTVDDKVPLGYLSDSIVMHTETGENPFFMGGDEVLNMAARVICRPDEWILNPNEFDGSDFIYTMNFNLSLNIEGVFSTDVEDIVGAYVNGELRGVSKVQYNPQLDSYLAFITVFSNVEPEEVEVIEFQIWDASECKLFAPISETYIFDANGIVGTALDPLILNTTGKVLRKIFIHPGWNWISMNLDPIDPLINSSLFSLSNTEGALIKTQGKFSSYSNVLEKWFGPLDTISPLVLYQYNSKFYDSLSMVGTLLDPNTAIPVTSGWNWLGYIPNEKLPIADALSSLTPTDGDLIKSQVSFAQYVNNVGWIGNLHYLDAPNGYLLKLANDDTLIYPDPQSLKPSPNGGILSEFSTSRMELLNKNIISTRSASHWDVDPSQFEHSMNAIGIVVKSNDENVLGDNDEVAAFVGDEVRGNAKAIYIPEIDSYMIFMTIYANQEGELLTFKFFDASENNEFELEENYGFIINQVLGEVDSPEPFHLEQSTGLAELDDDLDRMSVFPNPFSNAVNINFYSTQVEDIEVIFTDVYGSLIEKREVKIKAGMNVIEWLPKPSTVTGTYFITLKDFNSSYVKKVLYIK